MMFKTISPAEYMDLRRRGGGSLLVDVRTPVEFREIHAEGAVNHPLDQLDARSLAEAHAGEPIFLVCRSGARGRSAAEKIAALGHPNVLNVEGGTVALEQAGFPVVRGAKAMSLERQVRIAAGSLVLAGVILGFLVHPGFFGLSGFIGAGLIFAGVTDTCGMAMVLARMPWNKVATPTPPTGGAACNTR